jgi:hypothetical protein
MKKHEIMKMALDIAARDGDRMRGDRQAERDMEEIRMSRVMEMLPMLLSRIFPDRSAAGDPGDDAALHLSNSLLSLDRSLDPDQMSAIARLLTADQMAAAMDSLRLARKIMAASGAQPSDLGAHATEDHASK